MARILYGISGDGFGHSTRSKEAILHLQQSGHELCLVSYDKGYEMLSKVFPVEKISGLRLSYANNEVKFLSTVGNNLMKSKANVQSLEKVSKLAKKFKPDLVITDFEPTVNMVANWMDIPLISMDNQHVVTKAKIDVPERWLTDYLIAKLIIRVMVFGASKYIVLSFFDVEPNSSKAIIVPPIVRQEILNLNPTRGEHILVYLTAEDEKIIPALKDSREKYIVYGFDRTGREDNVIFKPYGDKDYLSDLETAKGIIATAGFSLMSEAFYLGKPFLAMPIKSTFEQMLNAHYLQKMDCGMMTEKFVYDDLTKFLSKLDVYSDKMLANRSTGNARAMSALDQAIKEIL